MQAPTGERIVEVRTLDALAREHEMDMIDFVKIDVEGAEGAVVHGMRDLLSHARVLQRLLIEVHGEYLERCGSSLKEMYADLRSAGYRGLSVREDLGHRRGQSPTAAAATPAGCCGRSTRAPRSPSSRISSGWRRGPRPEPGPTT